MVGNPFYGHFHLRDAGVVDGLGVPLEGHGGPSNFIKMPFMLQAGTLRLMFQRVLLLSALWEFTELQSLIYDGILHPMFIFLIFYFVDDMTVIIMIMMIIIMIMILVMMMIIMMMIISHSPCTMILLHNNVMKMQRKVVLIMSNGLFSN